MGNNVDAKAKAVAYKLRKIRELMNLTREEFCEPLKENVEYWGMIERGEQQISLLKLLQVCEVYQIPIEKVVQFDFQKQDTADLIKKINSKSFKNLLLRLLRLCEISRPFCTGGQQGISHVRRSVSIDMIPPSDPAAFCTIAQVLLPD